MTPHLIPRGRGSPADPDQPSAPARLRCVTARMSNDHATPQDIRDLLRNVDEVLDQLDTDLRSALGRGPTLESSQPPTDGGAS